MTSSYSSSPKKVSISLGTAKRYGTELGLNFETVSPSMFRKAMKIELEHGTEHRLTNITDDDLLLTAKIALAHLLEYPNYYEQLIEMERSLAQYWKGKKKPPILLPSRHRCPHHHHHHHHS